MAVRDGTEPSAPNHRKLRRPQRRPRPSSRTAPRILTETIIKAKPWRGDSEILRRRYLNIRNRFTYCDPIEEIAKDNGTTPAKVGRMCRDLIQIRRRNMRLRALWASGNATQQQIAEDNQLPSSYVWKFCQGAERTSPTEIRNRKIRALYMDGWKQVDLAEKFDITKHTVCRICKGLDPKTERNQEIRELHAEGVPVVQLAKDYGLTTVRIYQIVNE